MAWSNVRSKRLKSSVRIVNASTATRAIGDWFNVYNNRCGYKAEDMKTPAKAYALAAYPE
jgi:putative transposase